VEGELMAVIADVEAAVLERLNAADEELPKTIMDALQQRPEMTRAEVSEAIWRLVASRRVQFTKSLRLRRDGENANRAL
jgi:predicted transcriptional regulator